MMTDRERRSAAAVRTRASSWCSGERCSERVSDAPLSGSCVLRGVQAGVSQRETRRRREGFQPRTDSRSFPPACDEEHRSEEEEDGP